MVWEDTDDDAFFEFACDLQRTGEGCSARIAHGETFFCGEFFGVVPAIFGRDGQVTVRYRSVIDRWNDARVHVFESFQAVECTIGLDGDDTNIGLKHAQCTSGTGTGAGGTESGSIVS